MPKISREARLTKLAKQIAKTGRHSGWFHVTGELHDKGEPLAFRVLEKESVRSEIEAICVAARRKSKA